MTGPTDHNARSAAVWEALAQAYADRVDTKPHNALYDRPAVLSLLPDVAGLRVLDAGCGSGVYAEELLARGARVTACDRSAEMVRIAKDRLCGKAEALVVDLSQPLTMFADRAFDLVVSPLVLDHIEDWSPVFREFHRILAPAGRVVFSAAHPHFDAEYYRTGRYHEIEPVEPIWKGFGPPIGMPSYRRPLALFFSPLIDAGFLVERVLEPKPVEAMRASDPSRFERLMHRPSFLAVRAGKR